MNAFQMRHEGSPHVTSGLTAAQVMEGLHEGVWSPTDEVRGPRDNRWIMLEEHPHFAEAVADYEPPKKVKHVGEDNLDMNPLIDVALVLLIFFILTTTYDALRKVMDMPTASQKGSKVKTIDTSVVKTEFIRCKARNGPDGKPVYHVDDEEVREDQLQTAFNRAIAAGRNKLIVDAQDVSVETFIKIVDAGKGAKVEKIMMRVEKD